MVFFLGLGGAFSIYYLRNKSIVYFSFGLLLIFTSLIYVINGSITMIFILVTSLLLSTVFSKRKTVLSPLIRSTASKAGVLIISSVILFTAMVIYIGVNQQTEITIEVVNQNDNFQADSKINYFQIGFHSGLLLIYKF